jgi:hypothetical protein
VRLRSRARGANFRGMSKKHGGAAGAGGSRNPRQKREAAIKAVEAKLEELVRSLRLLSPLFSLLLLLPQQLEADVKYFRDLPLSEATARGLSAAGFVTLTDIQRDSLPRGLKVKEKKKKKKK